MPVRGPCNLGLDFWPERPLTSGALDAHGLVLGQYRGGVPSHEPLNTHIDRECGPIPLEVPQ